MNFATQPCINSFNQEFTDYDNKAIEAYQLGFIKCIKQCPENKTLAWLRSIQYANEKYTNKQKIKRFAQPKIQQNIGTKTKPLQKVFNLRLQSALYIVQTAIKECSINHTKYRSSFFNIKNCFINQEGKLIINSPNLIINAYKLISDETVVVRDIIESIHKICPSKCFDDFYSYYKRSSLKSKCDFKYTQSLIKSYCKCSKISVANCVQLDDIMQNTQKFQKILHSKSAERISPQGLLVNSMFRKISSSTSHRSSFHANIFNQSKQKSQNKKKYKNQQNVIKIQQNLIYDNALQQQQKLKSQIKISSVSTNFKSSLHNGDSLQVSTINTNTKNKISSLSCRASQNKQYFSFLPLDLDQVQSIGESSDQQSQFTIRTCQSPVDIVQQNIKKQNEERILTMNNWTRKIQGLLIEKRDLKQSINQDNHKQNYQLFKKLQHMNKKVQNFGENILTSRNQYHLRQS